MFPLKIKFIKGHQVYLTFINREGILLLSLNLLILCPMAIRVFLGVLLFISSRFSEVFFTMEKRCGGSVLQAGCLAGLLSRCWPSYKVWWPCPAPQLLTFVLLSPLPSLSPAITWRRACFSRSISCLETSEIPRNRDRAQTSKRGAHYWALRTLYLIFRHPGVSFPVRIPSGANGDLDKCLFLYSFSPLLFLCAPKSLLFFFSDKMIPPCFSNYARKCTHYQSQQRTQSAPPPSCPPDHPAPCMLTRRPHSAGPSTLYPARRRDVVCPCYPPQCSTQHLTGVL